MKLIAICFLICTMLLTLTGCTSTSTPSTSISTPSPAQWTPPQQAVKHDLSAEALSALNALSLCRDFVSDIAQSYPDYAPYLSEDDVSYYEQHLRDPDADISSLSAELCQTIADLRWQIYLKMESTTKIDNPLPNGLEDFLIVYETRFAEIGW